MKNLHKAVAATAEVIDVMSLRKHTVAVTRLSRRLCADERGGEVLEYAIVAGLIVVAAIAVVTKVGLKVLARWQNLNSSM